MDEIGRCYKANKMVSKEVAEKNSEKMKNLIIISGIFFLTMSFLSFSLKKL
jgi:hypothetical protein